MENYIQCKLMGRNNTKKLLLKRGVVPHKFHCRGEHSDPTTTQQVEKKSHKELIEEILKEAHEKEMEVNLDQRSKEEKKKMVINKKRKQAEEEKLQENLKFKKLEEEKILEQRKKIKRISHETKATEAIAQEDDIEAYTFQIKVEAEDDLESNDGDKMLEEFLSQGSYTAGHDNSLLDVNVKVEEIDEEFEPEVVDVGVQENIIEDDNDASVATEINPIRTENISLAIDKTDPMINEAHSVIAAVDNNNESDDGFDAVIIEETQKIVKESNPIITKTINKFVITEDISDKEVFQRIITGQQAVNNLKQL